MIKKVIIFLFIALLFFLIGFFSSNLINKKNIEKSYTDGWNAAKTRLNQTGASFERIELGIKVKSVYGTVERTEGNKVYAKIRPVEPLADPELDNRIILINPDTEIIKYIEKEEDQYNKELEQRLVQGDNEEPSRFYKKEMSLSDLKYQTNIVAHAENDIANEKQFIARQIVIYEN